jgi:hypothetical protein
MGRGNAGLKVIDAQRAAVGRLSEANNTALDHGSIPSGAILFMQTEEISDIISAGIQAGGVQQHERQEREGTRFLRGWMLRDQGNQPNGFSAEFLPDEAVTDGGFVSFVEKQVERVQHAAES